MDAAREERVRQHGILAKRQPEEYCKGVSARAYLLDFLGSVSGRTVLDLGCGYNPTPVLFALWGASHVYACDVSPRAIALQVAVAQQAGVADRVSGTVCAAERLPFRGEQIDLVHGAGVLHHLRLPLAAPEIVRVLRKGGKAGFRDPLGHNALLEFARDYLPYRWKHAEKATDRPLRLKDIEQFGRHFSDFEYRGFHLLTMLAIAMTTEFGTEFA